MATKMRELERELKDAGFYFLRRNKHPIYTDGITKIPIPSGNGFDYRLYKMIKGQIRKAIDRRQNEPTHDGHKEK